MSSIRDQFPEDEEECDHRRDCFGDRICDDLCQLILEGLTLKDKLRLECVSKQFQRTMVWSQRDLLIKLNVRRIVDNLERILKKFAISRIRFDNFSAQDSPDRRHYNRVIYNINKFCGQRTRFSMGRLHLMYADDRLTFLQKFGQNLSSAQIDSVFPDAINTSGEVCYVENLVIRSVNYYLNQIQFKRLKSFKVERLVFRDVFVLKVFAERNRKTLKYLTLNCQSITEEKEFRFLLTVIAKFTNLVHLSISSSLGMNEKMFAKERKLLALNCRHLKSIDFRFLIDPNICTTNMELLSTLRHFKSLKRLRLEFFNDLVSGEVIKSYINYFSLEAFNGFEELTHLWIDFRRLIQPLEETILTAIDTNLPNLQSLSIHLSFNASEWTADILSRLSKLESLELFIENEGIRPQIEAKLRENCKKLRKLRLKQF